MDGHRLVTRLLPPETTTPMPPMLDEIIGSACPERKPTPKPPPKQPNLWQKFRSRMDKTS